MLQIIKSFRAQLNTWAGLVKFSHTIFALPFALAMVVLAARRTPVTFGQVGWILVALVAARTAAMAFNRLVDLRIDSLNPRTRERELPAGAVSVRAVIGLIVAMSLLFLLAAGQLGNHCLVLAPLVLLLLFGYSLAKRFTAFAHLILGLALAAAPGGAWYALTADVSMLPVVLMVAVLFWVAGFDILYSCQDQAFDTRAGLHSVPVRWGLSGAFFIARCCHLLAVLLLVLFGFMAELGLGYTLGLSLFTAVLASQHWLVSPTDLTRINAAFFTRNGAASLIFLGAVVAG